MSTIQLTGNTLLLAGKIDFHNADHVYKHGLQILQSVKSWPIVVDLSNIENGNTLLLAIILQWLRESPSMDSIQVGRVPPQMLRILQASHLESLMI